MMHNMMIAIEDVDLDKIMISPVLKESRSYQDKEFIRTHPYVEVWYETPGHPFCPIIKDAKSWSGIQSSERFQCLYLSLQLSVFQTDMVKKIENRLAYLLFDVRHELLAGFPNLAKITHWNHMHFLLSSMIQIGALKHDYSQTSYLTLQQYDLAFDRFDDQLTTVVPSKNYTLDYDCECKETKESLVTASLWFVQVKYDDQIKIVTEACMLKFSHLDTVQNSHTGFVNHDMSEMEFVELGAIVPLGKTIGVSESFETLTIA
jgi:hypothetical protein